jgi:F-type H+-transporting ATPase subunit b
MTTKKSTMRIFASVFWASVFVAILALPAFAAEQAPEWRPTYDVIMMWVNFLILFGVLYKFLKNPLMDFFRGKKYELEKEIRKAEEQKEQAEAKIKESMQMLEEGEDRFQRIKERIVVQGEKKKAQIIEDAKQQSQYMLTEAKRKIDSHILGARQKLRAELIDIAFDKAEERLPEVITGEDSEKFVENYIKDALPS